MQYGSPMTQDAVVQVFFMREGKLIGRDHFYLTQWQRRYSQGRLLVSFIKQFYAGTPFIPKEAYASGRSGGREQVI